MRKSNWVFSITNQEQLTNIKETSKKGVKTRLDNLVCRVFIGPLEQANSDFSYPHRHCLIKIMQRVCNHHRVRVMIAKYLNIKKFLNYVSYLVSSYKHYIDYAWKTQSHTYNYVENAILLSIKKSGIIWSATDTRNCLSTFNTR